MSSFTSLTNVTTIKKGASVASFAMDRRSDGSIKYTSTAGNVYVVPSSNEDVQRIFDAINALV